MRGAHTRKTNMMKKKRRNEKSRQNRTEKTKGKRMKTCVSHLINNSKRQHVLLLLLMPLLQLLVLGWAKIRRVIQNSFAFQMQTIHFLQKFYFLARAFCFWFDFELLPHLNLAKFNFKNTKSRTHTSKIL